jgi:hypothetical protein
LGGWHVRPKEIHLSRLNELGPVMFDRIQASPFAVDRFGTTFGMLVRDRETTTKPGGSSCTRATTWRRGLG